MSDAYFAGVRAGVANCTVIDKQLCLPLAQKQEQELSGFCGSYGLKARAILDYKNSGLSAEMTAERMSLSDNSLSADLLTPLVRAAYSGNWASPSDFGDEAARRCLSRNVFSSQFNHDPQRVRTS